MVESSGTGGDNSGVNTRRIDRVEEALARLSEESIRTQGAIGTLAKHLDAQAEALNSIAPPQAVLGISWLSSDAAWDCALTGTFSAAKDENDIDQTEGDRFATPKWAVVDLSAGWRPNGRIELRAGIFNLTDKTYWRWLDVANMEADDPMIPLLSRPGRNYSVTARLSF